MFTNPSDKLKTGAALIFALQVLGAAGLLIYSIFNDLIIVGVISGGIIFLSAWYTALMALTWSDSAEYAEQAARMASECASQLKHLQELIEDPGNTEMPTWKRIASQQQ